MFTSIDTAATGLTAHRRWIDAIANNIANANTVRGTDEAAFRTQYVRARALPTDANGIGHGVTTTVQNAGDPNGVVTYDPENPVADAEGYVRRPDIDMNQQMGDLILAQRAFQMNSQMVSRAKEVYESAIAIGKGI